MTSIRLDNIRKHFGTTAALHDLQLTINAGELFFLLGPSGCGKSTLLRLIAGLLAPDAGGRIYFNDRDVTPLGTEKRNAVMCFQSYALWPHMSVRDNIRFGLDVRHLDAAKRDARIDEVLHLVQMDRLADRKPNELSGGQQQRVALARALAVEPDCLLLDEPLSNLDSKLRNEMRSEIRRICKTAGFTTIYVTHDQREAMSIADRIAVLSEGRLVQVGTPGELYHRPQSAFVADFIGHTNLLAGRIIENQPNAIRVETSAGEVSAATDQRSASSASEVTVSIRPEQIRVSPRSSTSTAAANRLAARLMETTFLGESSEHLMQVGDQRLKVICAPPRFAMPAEVELEFDAADVVVLDRARGEVGT